MTRYLALDLGERRIGVALSDTLGMLARPLTVVKRTSRAADFTHFAQLAQEHGAEALVVGLPLNMDGSEGSSAAWARDYSAELGATLGLPIHLWDERLTTEEAIAGQHAQGKSARKDWIDAVAAAVILQSFLDHLTETKR